MKDYKTSRFKRRIRISEENLEYVRRAKGKYTLAGMLDKIINQYKHEVGKGVKKVFKGDAPEAGSVRG